ncbi:MAG: cation diffusion facilitator family transporter [Desulfobacterales bacterium]
MSHHLNPKQIFKSNLATIIISFLVGAILMAVKFYAYMITGSSAILSDALESIINVIAGAFAMYSVIVSAKPPDESHPYGHGKIEYFSSGFEGALIIIAAIGIFKTGFSHILNPHPLDYLQTGIFILVGATALNLFLGILLIRMGKRNQSLILTADGKHILTDVYTSIGVLAGLFLVDYTGWYWLDGAIAVIVGINILITGGKLVKHSYSGLMNKAEPELLKEISDLLIANRKDIFIDIHQLRAWRSGNLIHIDFHLILPRDFSLECAHRENKALEKIIQEYFGGRASVLIHLDPCLDQECPICSQSPCMIRHSPQNNLIKWSLSSMTADQTNNKTD